MDKYPKRVSKIFERNIRQINRIVANIMAICSVVILLMTFLSVTGFFEFGTSYTYFVIIVGLLVSLSPKILSRFLSDNIMKYYMFISAFVFIGVMGANGHIGIYITYALVLIVSCLYFKESIVLSASAISYMVMLVSVYVKVAGLPEVLYGVYTRNHLFLSYAAYLCDLMNDSLEPIKQTKGSHSAVAREHMDNTDSYSEWIQYSYDHIVIRESAPDLFKYLCKLY